MDTVAKTVKLNCHCVTVTSPLYLYPVQRGRAGREESGREREGGGRSPRGGDLLEEEREKLISYVNKYLASS